MIPRQAQWLRYAAYSLVVVLVALGAYYFLYVRWHADQLARDRLSMLHESAGYFTEEIVRVKENIDNTLEDENKTKTDSVLARTLEEIEGISRTPVPKDTTEGTNWSQTCRHKIEKGDISSLYAQLALSTDRPQLHLGFYDDEQACRLATARPDSLLRPLLPQSETAFDQIMLARRDGTVLLQGNGEALSILNLPLHSPHAEDDTRRTEGLHTDIYTIDAGGTSYRVFLQPFRLPLPMAYGADTTDLGRRNGKLNGESLYLAGLKKESAFQAEARQLPPTLVFLLLGLLGLTLLAFPFLEVWFISPTERFKAHDILEVSVGLVITTGVITFALFSFFFYEKLKTQQSDHLERLSTVIQATVRAEADAAGLQLNRLTDSLRTGSTDTRKRKILADASVGGALQAYPHLEMASWINDDGKQVAKWSVEDQTTPLIDVADRPYFRAHAAAIGSPLSTPSENEVWRKTEGDTTQWVLQSIRSNNTGEVFAQISQVMNASHKVDGSFQNDKEAVVASATLPLLSLITPVLPTGYGFALINEEGTVLFHHDARRNLRENIFNKVGEREALREAVQARRTTTLTTRYRDNTYQFYSQHVEGSPWTLLVFSELESIRLLQGQILTYAVGLYLGCLFLLLLLALLPWMFTANTGAVGLKGLFQSVWPTPQKTALYRRLAKWEGSLLGIGLILIALQITETTNSAPLVIGGLFLVGILGVGLFCYYCGHAPPKGDEQWSPNWATNYYRSLVLLTLLLGSILPAGLYCALHDESTQLLTKKHQQTFANKLIERGDRIIEKYRRIPVRDTTEHILNHHLFPNSPWSRATGATPYIPWDVHTVDSSSTPMSVTVSSRSAEDGDTTSVRSEEAEAPLHALLASTAVPTHLSPWTQNLHVLSDSISKNGGKWKMTQKDDLIFTMASARRIAPIGDAGPEQEPVPNTLRLRSSVPTVAALLAKGPYTLLFGLFGIVIPLIVLLWYAHKQLTSQIFFLDTLFSAEAEEHQLPATYNASSSPPRTLFVQSHSPPRDDEDDSRHYINAAELNEEADAATLAQDAEASPAEAIVVDNFHTDLDLPEVAQAKLTLLEALVALDRPIEVYSNVEPLSVLRSQTQQAPSDQQQSNGRQAPDQQTPTEQANPNGEEAADAPSSSSDETPLDRWATVLRDFRRCCTSPAEADTPSETPPLDPADLHSAPDKLACLARECRPNTYLREDVAPFLADTLDLNALSEEEIIEQVRYQAEAHYQHLWKTCSDEEKVVLYRISTDGFASPHAGPIIRTLLRRGLVVAEPALRPMNESFRAFVTALDSPVVTEYERQSRQTSWKRIQTPLLIGVAAVLGFVFITQPALAQEASAILPTIAAGLPAILKIMSALFASQSAMSFTGPQ